MPQPISITPHHGRWYNQEIHQFRAEAIEIAKIINHRPYTGSSDPGAAIAGQLAAALLKFRRLAVLADYKERTKLKTEPFDYSKYCDLDAGTPKESVTLCGVCIQTNQLGNIMYGIIAARSGLTKLARSYAQGGFAIIGPEPPFSAPGEAYRLWAFKLGVGYEAQVMRGKSPNVCDYVKARAGSINQGAAHKRPCDMKHTGPQTDMKRDPLVKGDGNRN